MSGFPWPACREAASPVECSRKILASCWSSMRVATSVAVTAISCLQPISTLCLGGIKAKVNSMPQLIHYRIKKKKLTNKMSQTVEIFNLN